VTWSCVARAVVRRLVRVLFPVFEPLGIFIIANHFHEPIPDTRHLQPALWDVPSECVGIDWNPTGQMGLLAGFISSYQAEFELLPLNRPVAPASFYIRNESFSAVDAEVLYCMVRQLAPRRVFEVGGGYSTHLIVRALEANQRDGGQAPGELLVIEPYPRAIVRTALPAGARNLSVENVQSVGLDRFASLEANDILFVDSSHVLKLGSDLHFLFLEVLPRLKRGVVIHFHDIFLPLEYPKAWVLRDHRFWNEQYALQMFLTFNSRARVLWSSSYMHVYHADALERAFSSYRRDQDWPVSFWIQVV